MKRFLAAILSMVVGAGLTLAGVLALVKATFMIAQISSPPLRALAIAVELLLGVVVLVGSVFLATRLAVRLLVPESKTTRS